jgi:membrane protein
MSDQSRTAPLFGALIAAAVFYAATRSSDPPAAAQPPRPQRVGWGRLLANVWDAMNRDNVSVMAAGVAFFGFLSLFPALSAVISIYGLVADPVIIERQMNALSGFLPQEALQLISTQLHALIARRDALGIGLIISLSLTLWSAMFGTGTLMRALTVAYEETDTRGILHFYALSAALTIGIAAFGLVSLFLIAVVPVVIDWLPLPKAWNDAIGLIRWPLLAGLVFIALGFVFRFAPDRPVPGWQWLAPGTIAAAVLWLAGSAAFSFYVSNFTAYAATYGSLGAVVVLLMWLYVSAYIVLAGAELNSENEKAKRVSEHPAVPEGRPAR